MFQRYVPPSSISVVLTILMFLFLGYFPFNWEIPSNFKLSTHNRLVTYDAKRIRHNTNVESSESVLSLLKPYIAYLPIQPYWLDKVKNDSFLILEFSIQTSHLQQFGPARIFTISKDPKHRNITVAQEGSDLVLRLRTVESDLNGMPEHVIKNVFISPNKLNILIKILNRNLEIVINGITKLSTKLPQDALSNWNIQYESALGNELTFNRPWLGKIHKAAISTNTQSVDIVKNNILQIPHTYTATHAKDKQIRLTLFNHTGSMYNLLYDYVINFFGFFILGIISILLSKKVSLMPLILMCASLSLSIEIGQLFLETRYTDIHDFVLNSTGGFCGVLFGAWLILRSPIKITLLSPLFTKLITDK